jgi:carboxynorspermidine decarboxylase
MSHYTMVKTTTFNGIQLPAICTFDPESGQVVVGRSFAYDDFKGRLS